MTVTQPNTDELISHLVELRRALPSMRVGQLIAAMATLGGTTAPLNIYDMEDDELLAAMRKQLAWLAVRGYPVALEFAPAVGEPVAG